MANPTSSKIPSVHSDPLTESYTWKSPIPQSCRGVPCALGVDEAGRGPVLGPLVYGIAYCPVDYQDQMKEIGFADSKALTAQTRDDLLDALIDDNKNIGWAVRVLSPQSISSGMLRRRPINLNLQSSNATILLISTILESGIDLTEIYVDTVGDATSYQKLLSSNFPKHKHIKWVVTSKADSIYPIVGAASITAKVTRDNWMENWRFMERNFGRVEEKVDGDGGGDDGRKKEINGKAKGKGKGKGKRKLKEIIDSDEDDEGELAIDEQSSQSQSQTQPNPTSTQVSNPNDRVWILGSGYPGDPKTIQFLKDSIDPIFGYPGLVRFSWSTIKITLGIPDSGDKSNPKFNKNSQNKSNGSASASAEIKTKYNALKVRWMDEPTPISNFFGAGAGGFKKLAGGMGEGSEKEKWKKENEELKSGRMALWRDMGLNHVGPGGLDF